MGDAREKRTEHINAYITPGLAALLKAQCEAEERSMSFIIEKALQAYLSSGEAEFIRDGVTNREEALLAFGPDALRVAQLAELSMADIARELADATRRGHVQQG